MSTDKGEPTGEKEPDLVEEQPSAETVVAPEQVGQFGKQFFEFPETRVVTEFSKPVSKWETDKRVKLDFKGYELMEELQRLINVYIDANEGQIPDSFFEKAEILLKELNKIDKKDRRVNAENVLTELKVSAMCRANPRIICDPRFKKVLEELVDSEREITGFASMVGVVEGEFGGNISTELEGFGVEQLSAIEAIIDNPKLWQCKNRINSRPFLFSRIARYLRVMSVKYPSETLPLRLKLLRYTTEYENEGEIRQHLVYSFNTDEDRLALEEIIKEVPASRLAKEAQKILDGGYENNSWFT
ncbi:MAG: hypothetical protein ABID64_00695 [Nitrospirota bacterium]